MKSFWQKSSWFWMAIFLPFLASRVILVIAARLGRALTQNPVYPQFIQRGYFIAPHFLIDIWSTWDGGWYLSIARFGYQPSANLVTIPSNLAFFPLYPDLVRLFSSIAALVRPQMGFSTVLGIGIIFSSLCFLGALSLLYRMAIEIYHDAGRAERLVLLMIVFPGGYFLSSFYTESLFLLLSVAVFYTALHKKWILAALFCTLVTVTRLQGLFTLVPLLWMYFSSRQWKLKAIRWDFLCFGLPPLALAGHFYYLYALSGDLLAFFHAQGNWQRTGQMTPINFINELTSNATYRILPDFIFTVIFLGITLYLLTSKNRAAALPSAAFGIYALGLIVIPLTSLSWESMIRFLAVIFPVFFGLSGLTQKRWVYWSMAAVFMAVQIMLFIYSSNYYFVG